MNAKQYLKHCIRVMLSKKLLDMKDRDLGIQLCAITDDHIGVEIFTNELYEKETLLALKQFLNKNNHSSFDSVVLDVGANIGNHTIFFSKLFKSVVSFEPNNHIADMIEVNKVLNSAKNVKVVRSAIVEVPGEYVLIHPSDNVGAASLKRSTSPNAEGNHVSAMTGDEVDSIINKERVGLIKVDTEGMESSVFKALKNIIQQNYPVIAFEQNSDEIVNGSSESIKLLRSMGYNKLYAPEITPKSKFKPLELLKRLFLGKSTEYIEQQMLEKKFYPLLIMTRQDG